MSKYKLLKDLPNYKAGAILEWDSYDSLYAFVQEDINGQPDGWAKKVVENNSEWFEKVSDRIKVHVFPGDGTDCKNGFFAYTYTASTKIKESKQLEVQKAIEAVLNEDKSDFLDSIQPIVDENQFLKIKVQQFEKRTAQIDKAMEGAFNAAMDICEPLMRRPLIFPRNEFFQQYLNTINK